MSSKIVKKEPEEKNRRTRKKTIVYVSVWAAVLVFLLVVTLAGFGYEDDKDVILALMVLAVPFGAMLLDMFNFLRYEKYPTHGSFVFRNFIMVFAVSYVIECIIILAGFGLKKPQYKLFYTFALGGAAAAAVLNLLQTLPYAKVAKKI